jgi:uncharacterized lipoprotein YmbA
MKTLALISLLILLGCSSGTQRGIYVLSAPADDVAGVHTEDGRPVVDIRTVSLPDYLDTTDILLRDGRNELKASETGRWGERLSVGITDALIAALARRQPMTRVLHKPLSGQPARDLLVDIEAFDIQAGGQCVLTARWTILQDDRRTIDAAERGTFVTKTAGSVTDAAVASAMAEAVVQLADRIAADLSRGAKRPR